MMTGPAVTLCTDRRGFGLGHNAVGVLRMSGAKVPLQTGS